MNNKYKIPVADSDLLVASHVRWKLKLSAAIANNETLDVTTIAKDDCCVLGKWLHGTDTHSRISHLQSYSECLEKHATFHLEASKVAELVNTKQYDDAQQLLDNDVSDFNQASDEVISSIFKLEKDANAFELNTKRRIASTFFDDDWRSETRPTKLKLSTLSSLNYPCSPL